MTPAKTDNNPPLLLVVLLAIGSFVLGTLWTQVQNLEQKLNQASSQAINTAPQPDPGNNPNNNPPPPDNQPPSLPTANNVDPVTQDDHLQGNPDAPIILIEYSDLECPFCKRFHPTVKQALEEYGDQIAWVYRHFPLTQIHPQAQQAAEASECVAELGGNNAFWQYIDKLFTGSDLSQQQLTTTAAAVGVNQSLFESCLDSGKYTQKINDQLASGQNAGVTGTPGTIILRTSDNQTQLIPGALPYEQIKQAIDSLIK